jgi:CDP-glucose 4,6-dehydratase
MVKDSFFSGIYNNKKVLVTGNTGFKGCWLTVWLLQLGADVYGISKDIPTRPSMFEELALENKITHHMADIRDYEKMYSIIDDLRPDFIFHMAAQPIVSKSYHDPLETITSNVVGTANILEVLRKVNFDCKAIIVTSDKCYDNVEWVWGYKENDALGGKDIYSGSKGAAELVFKSYYHSFFKTETSKVSVASARAGNVIGGGDWALDRIVPDSTKAWSENRSVEIRSPNATRPWQHVLEPLSGYLQLGWQLAVNKGMNGESFNFGPRSEYNNPVKALLEDLGKEWGINNTDKLYHITDNIPFHEAGLLKLNCDKAFFHFRWVPTLNYQELIKFTGKWYYSFYHEHTNMYDYTVKQLDEYLALAENRNITWTQK